MVEMKMALTPGGARRLSLNWYANWTRLSVALDDAHLVGVFESREELERGKQFTLPDTSLLHVQLVRSGSQGDIQVLRDGKPLFNARAHLQECLKKPAQVLFVFAALNVILNVISLALESDLLMSLGLGTPFSFVFGGLLVFLGYLIQQGHALGPILAVTLYVCDTLLILATAPSWVDPPMVSIVIPRAYLIYTLWQAMKPLKAFNALSSPPGTAFAHP